MFFSKPIFKIGKAHSYKNNGNQGNKNARKLRKKFFTGAQQNTPIISEMGKMVVLGDFW